MLSRLIFFCIVCHLYHLVRVCHGHTLFPLYLVVVGQKYCRNLCADLVACHDDRVYPPEQVVTLRLLRRLVDAGHRPGKVVGRSDEDLLALLAQVKLPAPQVVGFEARQVLQRLGAYDPVGLRDVLSAIVTRAGLGAFAAEIGPGLLER